MARKPHPAFIYECKIDPLLPSRSVGYVPGDPQLYPFAANRAEEHIAMTRWTTCAFLLAAGLIPELSSISAFAACSPATGSNTTVTCSGATFNQGPGINTGYGDSTQNGLALTVNAGASVTGTSTGIDVNNNNVIVNLGTITTMGSNGIGDVFGINANGALTLINSGSIGRIDIPDNIFDLAGVNGGPGLNVTNNNGALIQGAVAIQGVSTATITNSGMISGVIGGGGQGINVNGGSVTVINNSTGLITADGFAITADNVTATNYGQITASEPQSGGTGISGNVSATVTNYGTGLITGDGAGISAPTVTVTNFGTISGTGLGANGILGGSVQVTNSGMVTGGTGAAAIFMTSGSVTNNTGGTITGDEGIAAFGGTSIFDAGTIIGNTGTAIAFQTGGNTLTLGPGFTINGNVLGAGTDTFQLGGSGNGSFNLSLLGTQYTGFTTFNVISGNWNASGTGTESWGISGGNLMLGSGAQITGDVTLTGGELSGTGTVGGLVTNNSGIVAPGPPGGIGTLTVGTYTQGSGGTLSINVSPTSASQLAVTGFVEEFARVPGSPNASTLIEGGAANLAGTLALMFENGIYKLGTSYTILTAPTLTGQFSTIISNNTPPGLAASLIYQEVQPPPPSQLTSLVALAQQSSVILQLVPGTVAPSNATIFSAVTSTAIITAQEVNGIILDRVGQRTAGVADGQIAALGGVGAPTALQLAQAGPGNAGALADLGAALPQLGEGAWFRGVGGFASVNGSSTAPGFTGSTGGFLAGYDRAVAPNAYLGIAGGYLHSAVDEHSTSNGTEESARFHVYGGMLAGPSLFSATAGYAHDWFDTQRGLAGIGTASQSHSGNEATAAGQWSLPLSIQGYGGGLAALTPKVGIEYLHLSEDAFAETGALDFNLANSGHGTDSLQPYLGAALAQKFVTDSGTQFTPELRLGYSHEIFDSRLLTIATASTVTFPIEGVKPSRDQVTTGIGVSMVAGPNLSFYADYDAILPTGNTVEQTVQAGLRWKF